VTESSKPATPAPLDPTTQYAADVVAGRIVAGRLVKLACERHLRDLESGAARGLRFDAPEAAATIDFWETCPHLKGKFAKRGETLRLQPWQRFIIGSVYGWKRRTADGWRRRFRVAWVELARKNGKSTMLYPAALHALALDGEEGAEVYSVATKRDQAKLTFDLAKRAVTRSADLGAVITPYAFSLVAESTFSRFEAVSADADTLDGLNPHVVLADEVHKWKGRALWDVIETGLGAREQPILWAITTAGEEGEEDAYGQEHGHGVQVLEGVIEDDTRFAFIACLDPEDDWTDPANFVKANPNLGVSVEAEEIAGQVKRARQSPAAANAVKRLRLGLRTQAAEAWIPLQLWDRGADRKRVTREALKGFPCFGGLDLASTCDFAALALAFPLTEDYQPAPDPTRPALFAYLFRLWMPAEGKSWRETKLREIARPWLDVGWVTATDGDAIDHGVIRDDILKEAEWFRLSGLAYDPYNAAQIATELGMEGVECVKFEQQLRQYAEPTKAFETDLLNGWMRHDGNPCVRWMANNVVIVSNGAGHQMPGRKKSRNKIDAIPAAIMARGRAAAGGGRSYYESNGVEVC
jgi:phage terminase large subunit-like protein